MHALFAYGTLGASEFARALLGWALPWCYACLDGYRRARVTGASYLGLYLDAGSRVFGQVYTGLGDEEITIMGAYEGPQYSRVTVNVGVARPQCPTGDSQEMPKGTMAHSVRAHAYPWARVPLTLSEEPRCLDTFRDHSLARYVQCCARLRVDFLQLKDIDG